MRVAVVHYADPGTASGFGDVFSPAEREYCAARRGEERWAGRLAAKRAILAVLAIDEDSAALRDVEVLPGPCEREICNRGGHRPVAVLHGDVRRRWEELGAHPLTLSITHAGGLAAGLAAS